MSKEEWGVKRTCLQCGEHFYDLKKDPIVCPHCGESVSLAEFLRLQLVCGAKNKRMLKNKLHENDIADVMEEDSFDAEVDVSDDDDLELMEDVSDMSDDNHDMASVMDNMEKGEE